jgi:L-lactate dehydrogenase complex protein LldF
MLGLESTYPLAFASTLCGACGEVCPVKIPIPDILVRLRNEAQAKTETGEASLRGSGAARTLTTAAVWTMWSQVYSRSGMYRLASWFMSRGRSMSPSEQGAWTQSRTPLVPAPKRLRDLLQEENKK